MLKYIKLLSVAAAASLTIIACNDGKDKKDPKDSTDKVNDSIQKNNPSATTKSGDAEFLVDAGYGGTMEVKSSEAVKAVSKNADVITLADMMIKDHTSMGDKIKALATAKNVAIPKDLNESDTEKVNDLQTDRDADKDYADMMVRDHEKTIKLFEKGDKEVTDADIKALITDALPKLRAHLDHAKQLKAKLK